jgi:hypothetical protein
MNTSAIDGRSGFCKDAAAELTIQTAVFAGGFGFITAKGASSYFDTLKDAALLKGKALVVGAPVELPAWETTAGNPLTDGDKVMPFSMDISCWTTDCPVSSQEGELDQTTQCDKIAGRKKLAGDGIYSESGTINGLFQTDSEMQREIEGLFRTRIVAKAGKVTMLPRDSNKQFMHFFIYREMAEAGEVEITLFRKMRIPQISAGQAATGNTPFNFNYTTLESWQYENTVPASAE